MKEKLLRSKTAQTIMSKVVNLGYVVRLMLDQNHVSSVTSAKLAKFQTGRTSKLGLIADDFTAQGEKHKNLELVIEAVKSAGIDYFLVPNFNQTGYKVGILSEDKNTFFDEIAKRYSDSGLYITMPNKYKRGSRKRQIVSTKRSLDRFFEADIIGLHTFVLSPKLDLMASDEEACYVEFWERSNNVERRSYLLNKLVELRLNTELDLLQNTLIAPVNNPYSGILPLDEVKESTIKINGKNYRTYDAFTQLGIHDIDFPIDIVYAWVDGNDPAWKKRFNKYRGITTITSDRNNTESRYKDRQELKYSLRSVHMYAPFVRNIYIVTDRQVPDWLDLTVPGVKIVDHKDIFFDPSVLPIFNSHAIGSQLHHIKGLSDRYLYLNDDVMFGRTITPHKFFYGSGIAKIAASPALINAGSPKDYEPAPSSAGKNVRKALQGTFNRQITHKYKHAPNPQIKEVCYELEEKYSDLVKRTASSRFRDKTDIQFAGLLHHSYSLITGKAVLSDMRAAVVNISQVSAHKALRDLLNSRDAFTICLNESETPASRQEEVAEMVQDFLERYYPYPSPWEK